MANVPFHRERLRFLSGSTQAVTASTTTQVQELVGTADYITVKNSGSVPVFGELGTSASVEVDGTAWFSSSNSRMQTAGGLTNIDGALGDHTIVWLYRSAVDLSAQTTSRYFGITGLSTDGFLFRFDHGTAKGSLQYRSYVSTVQTNLAGAAYDVPNDYDWHYIYLTLSGTTITAKVDGVTKLTGTITKPSAADQNFMVGYSSVNSSPQGQFRRIACWSSSVDYDTAIAAIEADDESTMEAYYKFQGGYTDSTANGNDLTQTSTSIARLGLVVPAGKSRKLPIVDKETRTRYTHAALATASSTAVSYISEYNEVG